MKSKMFTALAITIMLFLIANVSFANDQISFQIRLVQGWNLISVPFDTSSSRLFEATSIVYTFSNGEYVAANNLKAGKGYWVKALESVVVDLIGTPDSEIHINYSETWQLVGTPGLSTTTIKESDDTRVSMYTYIDGEYQIAEQFEPGHGYWVKANKITAENYDDNVPDLPNIAKLKHSSIQDSAQQIFRQNVIEFMERVLDENLENALNTYCPVYDDYYIFSDISVGLPASPVSIGSDANYMIVNDGPLSTPVTPENEPDNGASEYSETNNQVSGVDEADFIKNDGKHIFVLADNQLKIVKAWPPKEAGIIASVYIEGSPKKLFIHNNRAVVYSSLGLLNQDSWYLNKECTDWGHCVFTGDNKRLKITILDISIINSSQIIRELYFNGSFISARRIDNAIHSVILFPEMILPGVKFEVDSSYCDCRWFCCDPYYYYGYDIIDYFERFFYPPCYPIYEKRYSDTELITKFEALKQKNKQVIMNLDISDFSPTVRDVQYIGGEVIENVRPISDFQDIYFSPQTDGMNFLSLFSFDIQDTSSQHAVTMMGKPGAVYSSRTACYIASPHRKRSNTNTPWYILPFWGSVDEITTIHKFTLSNDAIKSEYAGSGSVKGRVLNQFAMDEHNNFLRIATTVGNTPWAGSHNILSILKESSDGNLEIISKIDNIAPTEDIKSVRFNENKGFIVTFKQTDPLFAFDLSNPYSPVQTGELKIPGFSTYIHLMDDNHLLSIGYDGDDQGAFSGLQGIALQLFDISDMKEPKCIYKEVIGSRRSSSEAVSDHLAFNFFSPKDLLAIPMAICEGGSSYGYTNSFSGLMIFKTTIENGFEYLGGVSHGEADQCYKWWTDPNTHVKRSIFMDDYVYSVALDMIKINKLSALGDDIAEIKIQ